MDWLMRSPDIVHIQGFFKFFSMMVSCWSVVADAENLVLPNLGCQNIAITILLTGTGTTLAKSGSCFFRKWLLSKAVSEPTNR
jgi:hypothetical protein